MTILSLSKWFLPGCVLFVSVANAQIKLSDSGPDSFGGITSYAISPNGARAVFAGDLTTIDGSEYIYGASTTASGTQIQLSNNTPVEFASASDIHITPDSARVVYVGNLDTDNIGEIYSASTTASGTQIKLNTANAGGSVNGTVLLTTDGARVIYKGDFTTDGVLEMYSASTTASGTQIKLSSTLVAGGDVGRNAITPDNSRVVYSGDLTIDNTNELYSASTTAAGTQIKLSNTLVVGGQVYPNAIFKITADSSRVVYNGSLNTAGVDELYSASTTAAGTQIKLNSDPVSGGDVSLNNINLTPDSARAIYLGDLDTDSVVELYSASTTAAGTQIKLSNTFIIDGDVVSSQLTPDGARAIYRGDLDTDEVFELYSASTTAAGTQITLNNTPVSGGDVSSFSLTPDGSRALYVGDLNTNDVFNLYSASTTAGGTQINLSLLTGAQDVNGFAISPDGQWVSYYVSGASKLMVADILGATAPVQVQSGGFFTNIQFGADNRLYFVSNYQNPAGPTNLYVSSVVAAVPEPGAFGAIIGCALLALALRRKRA
jgi:hypothetical protein